jgi:hypothetical protein
MAATIPQARATDAAVAQPSATRCNAPRALIDL